MTPRHVWSTAALLVGLAAWVLLQADRCHRALDLQHRKTAELHAARTDARRILELRRLPRRASDTAPKREFLHAALEEAARSVGLPPAAVAAIQPSEPQRLGRSAYQEVTTTVTLRGLKLRQLAELLLWLRARRPEFRLKELRLAQTNRGMATWDATLVLAFLVFEPAGEPL